MPIQDVECLLRDGSSDLTGAETGDGVLVGDSPIDGALGWIYCPAGWTGTWAIQQSDDDSSYSALSPAVGETNPAAGYREFRAYWTKPYLRMVVAHSSGTPGAVQIGVTIGKKPLS